MDGSLEIARTAALRPIGAVAEDAGLRPAEVEPHGAYVAKVEPTVLQRIAPLAPGKLVVVTAVTPTPRGEGKTTTVLGLADALRRRGVRAIATLRQPSLGPVFGAKGGGSGGGRAQVVPAERVNLHLTGDFHAVSAAHGLAAALVDNHLHHGNALGIEPGSVTWPRALDVNDRTLRDVVIGLGGRAQGPVRETAFVITAASEVMAILSLARDLADLRVRVGRAVVGRRKDGTVATLEDLRAAGAVTALLVDAMNPNLLQTLEGSPVLVHTGPFGNVSHGASSIVADQVALGLAELVVTEAGFGADLGAEKFLDIKCRQGGAWPAAAVLVGTVDALRRHGRPAGDATVDDATALRRGTENLARHLAVLRLFSLPTVVAVNRFEGDGQVDLEVVRRAALEGGATAAVVVDAFARGGEGALELADAVRDAVAPGPRAAPTLLYPDDLPLRAKIETIATRVYGAATVDFAHAAEAQLDDLQRLGFASLPVCVAKTHLSFSHDPLLGPHPRGFRFPVRELRLAAGAGFVTAVAGDIQLMPGLPARPAAERIDVSPDGVIGGLR